ncbi:MAG: hypothetical protein ACR2N7_05575 [Acidimicrobiia bacterium]
MTTGEPSTSDGSRGARLVHIAPLVPLLIVGVLAARSIKDNSFLWHIRAGSVQLSDQQVLNTDPFSFTRFDDVWRTQSWLAEFMYAGLESTFGGLAWVNWMVFFAGATVTALVGLSVYRVVKSPVIVGFVLLVAVWLMGPFLQPRPVIFSFVLLAALVLTLQNTDRIAWIIVPLIWIWAGVHGSWVIGGLLIVLELIRTKNTRLLWAGLGALAASLATAHGFGTWQIVLDFFGSRDALALMEEWKPPEFADIVQAPYFLLIVGVIVAAMRGKIAARDLIVILPFMLFGMTSRRAVFPAAIVLIPWAAMAIPPLKASASALPRRLVAAVGALMVLLAVSPLLLNPLGVLDPNRFPSSEILSAMPEGRAFHDDATGGYFIYAEWPERHVYIDDRAELYGAEGLLAYQAARNGRYEATFDRYDLDVALTHIEWPLTAVLRDDGWAVAAEDDRFAVFLRP